MVGSSSVDYNGSQKGFGVMAQCPNCNIPIDEHEAGHKTDACVAVIVMGWKQSDQGPLDSENWTSYPDEWYENPDSSIIENVTNIPSYSTDIAAAWEIIHKFVPEPPEKRLADVEIAHNGFQWFAGVTIKQIASEDGEGRSTAATAPLAICRAAIQAAQPIEIE